MRFLSGATRAQNVSFLSAPKQSLEKNLNTRRVKYLEGNFRPDCVGIYAEPLSHIHLPLIPSH